MKGKLFIIINWDRLLIIMTTDELEKLTFEDAMKELEKLVDSLDKGDISLDEAIAAYDRGSKLKDYCQKKLQEAKMKIETIQSSDNNDTLSKNLSSFKSE